MCFFHLSLFWKKVFRNENNAVDKIEVKLMLLSEMAMASRPNLKCAFLFLYAREVVMMKTH